ncbi:O-methyltransferase [Radiobacillus sp. PE A8.2]|uniref:O-methyltransferase n=1 Tax=Radiobacillus sp. PE A8.2 TaxID=3380349 RepID=UPI00388EA0F7
MEKHLEQYLLGTLDKPKDWVTKLEAYAKINNVPIMEPLGIDFLMQMVRMKQPKKILEIGTAIGYSALRMLEAHPQSTVVTVERDEQRYSEAVKNIQELSKQNKINVIFGDAFEQTNKIKDQGPYDMLFIDAAKGQYQRFFEIFSEFLTEDAIIISDNVLFKGFVAHDVGENKRISKIAKKLRTYNGFLTEHPLYRTTIVPIGDGIAVSVKR